MHHVSVSAFLCRPWLPWRWLTRRSLTPAACRYPVRCAQSSTHASLLWRPGQNDSLLSLYLFGAWTRWPFHVPLPLENITHIRFQWHSTRSSPCYKYSVSHLESFRSSVFTLQLSHLHRVKNYFFSARVQICVSSWWQSNDGSFLDN